MADNRQDVLVMAIREFLTTARRKAASKVRATATASHFHQGIADTTVIRTKLCYTARIGTDDTIGNLTEMVMVAFCRQGPFGLRRTRGTTMVPGNY
jgi:hypothetical protein